MPALLPVWALGAVATCAVAPWHLSAPDDGTSEAVLRVGAGCGPPPAVRWIAAGGGSTPDSNQVSLEQDLELAAKVFGRSGRLLFGGGARTHGVQVMERRRRGDALVQRLGEFFAPRGGRDASYRKVRLPAHGPATADALTAELQTALETGEGPLLVYLNGHGDPGETAAEVRLRMWGGWSLTPAELARSLDAAPPERTVRVVMTSCYSGGFADLVFTGADAATGAAGTGRCGLFATTWNREASGCDPNPDRGAQEGYGLHFLNALRGRDREGRELQREVLDLDGDGSISLLEAHTRARLESRSVDVPTTTSERWLRQAAPRTGPRESYPLPEEEAVIRVWEARLGLDARTASGRLEELEGRIARFDDELDLVAAEVEDAWWVLAAELLARWPVLDDPYHPDYPATLAENRRAITSHLTSSKSARRYRDLEARLQTVQAERDGLVVESAPVERLVRAHENRELAARLKHRGGSDWRVFRQLLSCERSLP